MTNTLERRKQPRVEMDIEAAIQVFALDGSFTPYQFRGKITDLSEEGMRLAIRLSPRSAFRPLLPERRLVRVRVPLSKNAPTSPILGKIQWLDFGVEASQTFCRIGVRVEEESRVFGRPFGHERQGNRPAVSAQRDCQTPCALRKHR
jgi:hypothetical protein